MAPWAPNIMSVSAGDAEGLHGSKLGWAAAPYLELHRHPALAVHLHQLPDGLKLRILLRAREAGRKADG